MRLAWFVGSVFLLGVGCGGSEGSANETTFGDAGTADVQSQDTGTSAEGGPQSDAASSADSGSPTDAGAVSDSGAGDAGGPVDAEVDGVTSTLVAQGCPAAFSTDRVMVHYNTSLGIVFTDPDVPYTVRGSVTFDFPSTFTGPIPNPYSWVDSGVHKEVAVVDEAYTTWGNHCWQAGDSPNGGSAIIEVINGPEGVVRATFDGFELRNCVNQSATCTLSGSIESSGTGVFE